MKQIAKKLVQVMADCAYVQKNGTNDFHRYKYATAADVLEKVNASLVKHGVAVTAQAEMIDLREVTTAKGNLERLATVRTTLDGDLQRRAEDVLWRHLAGGPAAGGLGRDRLRARASRTFGEHRCCRRLFHHGRGLLGRCHGWRGGACEKCGGCP